MSGGIDWTALWVFIGFFVLVTAMGFFAARWRRPRTLAHLDEWGLGGRTFGTWITWFLVGGDFYTAYTVIAVPAVVYAVGAYGFFALPYTIIVYPIVFAIMPKLWAVAAAGGHVTAADVVHARYNSRPLELAVAITGVLATMPYIALQLVGMEVVLGALGLTGEVPLAVAFIILGSVLEGIPAVVLFGPLLFPIARSVGVHEVHYAMVVILAMGVGLFAPPFGVGYYAACAISRIHPDAGMRPIVGYILALLAGLLAVILVPWFSIGFL